MKQTITLLLTGFILIACQNDQFESDAFGNFEAEEVFVSSETSGKLIEFKPEEGDLIKMNQVIGVVDTLQAYYQLQHLRASLNSMRSRLQDIPVQLDVLYEQISFLQREKERIQGLLEGGAATQKQYDEITSELSVLESRIKAQESQLSVANQSVLSEMEPMRWKIKQMEDLVSKSVIRSPMEGTVLQKFRSKGEVVAPGIPVVKMARLDPLILRVFISEDQLNQVTLGKTVEVLTDAPNGEFFITEGKVQWVSSRAEFTPKYIQTRKERVNLVYAVKIRVNNDGRFKIGMPAEIRFIQE
jgi:HlyD family secretion protein